jgi:hypothetical protein
MSDKIQLSADELARVINAVAEYTGEVTYVLTYVPGVGWVLQPQPLPPQPDRLVVNGSFDDLVRDQGEPVTFSEELDATGLLIAGAELSGMSTYAKHENGHSTLASIAAHLLHAGVSKANAKHENSGGTT